MGGTSFASDHGKSFSYPVYFVSEDYQLIESEKEKKSNLEILPNRSIVQDQIKSFKLKNQVKMKRKV